MLQKTGVFLFMFFIFILLSCASNKEQKATRQPETEYIVTDHKYPFTEVMGDYHIVLIVDHAEGKMSLVTTDISEKPVTLLHLHSIKGEVLFPDGTVKEVIFRPSPPIIHKHVKGRWAGEYIEYGEWLKTTPDFTLHLVIPFKGQKYEITFDYKVPDDTIKIPVHRH
jgi:hypothetical protein